jgi:hypothetical protein
MKSGRQSRHGLSAANDPLLTFALDFSDVHVIENPGRMAAYMARCYSVALMVPQWLPAASKPFCTELF